MIRGSSKTYNVMVGIVCLIVAITTFRMYLNTQSSIQLQQQLLQDNKVMCGNQQMKVGDQCSQSGRVYSNDDPVIDDPSLYTDSKSYAQQYQANQQKVDSDQQANNKLLIPIVLLFLAGLLSLFLGPKKS